ncbi:MAG TPA: DUF2795 domain-containing protein [Catenuloplanes sp.]|jgi:hypothetical protein
MENPGWTSVAEALNDLDFPATKQEIVDHALDKRASHDALRLLRGLPIETYRNISEVRSSVPLDPARDDGGTPADKAAQARSPHSKGIAEHLRRTDD